MKPKVRAGATVPEVPGWLAGTHFCVAKHRPGDAGPGAGWAAWTGRGAEEAAVVLSSMNEAPRATTTTAERTRARRMSDTSPNSTER